MKWNLIKLLCEYSDDFSSESFKDLVDSIDLNHEVDNRLIDDFIGFIHAFDTKENDIFVNGYQDSTEMVDNGITKEQIEQHKLNKDKLRRFQTSRELRRLVNDLNEDEEALALLNNKARMHFKQYRQILNDIYKQSISLRSLSDVLWSDDPELATNVDNLEKLARILITVDLQDIQDSDAKSRIAATINRIERTLSYISLTHMYEIERHQRVARKGKYEDEVRLSDHEYFNTNYFSMRECSDMFNKIYKKHSQLTTIINKFSLSHRVSMAGQEGSPPFDPNNPPNDFIQLIHQTEQLIVDIAEELDLI